jgi:hypothetical protein
MGHIRTISTPPPIALKIPVGIKSNEDYNSSIAEVSMSGPCVFLTLIHVYFSLISLCNIFQCAVDKSQKLIPFFSTYIFFYLVFKNR